MNSYKKINYVNGSNPSLSAANLNHMDDGIEAATQAITEIEAEVAKKANTTDVNKAVSNKADNALVATSSEGMMTFAPYSDFFNGQVGNSGTIDRTNTKYRVTSENIMKFDYDLNIILDDGFTADVVEYDGSGMKSIKNVETAYNYVIPAGTEFRLRIRRTTDNTSEIADINEFVNSVKFQTKTAVDISEINAGFSEISKALKETSEVLAANINLKWLQGNVPPSGGGVGTRILSVLGLMNQPFTISWTDDKCVVKVWVYDSDDYSNRTENISVNSGDTVTPMQDKYYVILAYTEDNAVIKPAYGNGITVRVALQKVTELENRVQTIEDKINSKQDGSIPEYYYADNYLPDKINEIKQACAIKNGVTFAFITDVHFKMNQCQSKKLLQKILKETNVPFVIFGGDIVYLEGTEEELHKQIAEFNDFKSYIGKDKLFCTRGNHELYNATNPGTDNRQDHYLTTADVYDTLFRDIEHSVSSMSVDSGCYCIDNEPQKTRIIMLNTSDVSGNVDYQGGGVSFRPETLMWLSSVLTEKTNYKIIIVCHTPLNYEKFTNDNNSYENENRDGLSLMVQAFKNKTAFETTRYKKTVQADFTNTTNELICVVSGHRHIDDYSVENNVLNIVTTCDCIDKKDNYKRTTGTIIEQAFDIYAIDYDTKKINLVRIGAGDNREFDLPEDLAVDNNFTTDKQSFIDDILSSFTNVSEVGM
ncbi:MAG: metallophosphoesterase [Ruminococcus sp.]|nr:metallophosphoesterase [Ruminococcus sp.]